ncbi:MULTISPECIES: nuclear transport factor 2 family protein [unclassified Mesorhizobium]|uniref:nuclear transport factor 2 family protein n=1 Tax=unclassified Mesorhizobium TaxID=325217 RepID=UPI0015E412CB|nr:MULTISPECIES: nuclear transport factor 2 family protein [unclassified Mesorhizobium]
MSVKETAKTSGEPINVVKAFMDAWEAYDLEEVMETVGDEIMFVGTTGPEPGRTFKGKVPFSKVVDPLLSPQSTISLKTLGVYPCGETVFVVWETTDWAADPRVSKMRGVDLFQVSDGKIVLKDAYRKSY